MTLLPIAVDLVRAADRRRPRPDPAQVARLRARLEADGRLRRAHGLVLVPVETGCCGACAAALEELRLTRLGEGRFGLRFTERPAEADVLLATGLAVRNAARPMARAWEQMAAPRIAVAIGDCAALGTAPEHVSYASEAGGANRIVPVDLAIRGAPPTPDAILVGLLTLLEAACLARR